MKSIKSPKKRCFWCSLKNPLYVAYHDNEWGVPCHDERKLYEYFILETFQAGLSWECILNKRENFRKAYDNFDLSKVCAYDDGKLEELMQNPGLIRNRAKLRASIRNSRIYRDICTEYGGFDAYLRHFTGGRIIREPDIRITTSPLSDAISADLKKRGMSFVGSTTVYAFLQAIGVINAHSEDCFCAARSESDSILVKQIAMPEWLQKKELQDRDKIIPGDEEKIRYVVQLAVENVKHKTGGPFAAAIFDLASDRMIALGINVVVPANQSWAHAEMTAFAHAQNRLQKHSLDGCVLVTSCEPCAMCSGATPWSGVEKMIYGATKRMAEAAGFDEGYKGEHWREEFEKRGIRVIGPLLGKKAQAPFDLYRKQQGIVY